MMIKRRNPATGDEDGDVMDEGPASHRLATSMGVSAHSMQMMKASFFGEEEKPHHGVRGRPRNVL